MIEGGSSAKQEMVAFPLAKLAAVTLRQASRPLARMVEELANRSSVFRFSMKKFQLLRSRNLCNLKKLIRRLVCLPLAQFYHYYEVKMKIAALNLGVGKVLLQSTKKLF